jgi:predicted Zn-dependent peptidase
MTDVQIKTVNEKSKLFYTKNPENEVFTLRLKYGVGTAKMPNLDLAAYLMNNAGIMGQMEAQEVKQMLSNLGASCNFYVDDSYLTIIMQGFESNLKESCNLLTRQVLFPKLDEKQMNSLKSVAYQGRQLEKESTEDMSDALNNYLLYQNKSDYIDRPELDKILDLTISNLTGDFQRATDYEAEIHYVGNLPFETVYEILSANLPLKVGEKESASPEVKDRVKYQENTIYFVHDKDAQQCNVYFFIEGDPYDKESDVYRNAFNQYFSGGFNGLVMQEIREYRSMAYTTYGAKMIPPVTGKNDYFMGYIGTQADKVVNALDVYLGLINDMPLYPERLPNIKNYLKEVALTSKPHFRYLSATIESWKLRGYTEDPAKENLDKIENLAFDDIVNYYETYIKGRPLGIAIIGNSSQIDTKSLEKFGKVVKLNSSKLFSNK